MIILKFTPLKYTLKQIQFLDKKKDTSHCDNGRKIFEKKPIVLEAVKSKIKKNTKFQGKFKFEVRYQMPYHKLKHIKRMETNCHIFLAWNRHFLVSKMVD